MLKKLGIRALIALSTLALPLASASGVAAIGPTGTYSSGIACVNLGAAAASIAITFYNADNGTAITTYSVPSSVAPKANVILFTPSIPGLPGSLQGSAVVSSDQQVACTADAQRSDGTPGTVGQPARSSTSESFDTTQAASTLYATQVVKTLGNVTSGVYDSYIAVQNIESSAVTVTVSYVDRFGVAYPAASETVSIPAQASHYFYQSTNVSLPASFLGSAKIVASDSAKKIAATAVMYNDGSSVAKSQMLAYNASGAGGSKLIVPQWVRNYYGYQSGGNIMNIGATTTTVTSTFTINATPYVQVNTLGPQKVLALFSPSSAVLLPVDSLAVNLRTGSAVFQTSPGGTIVANINLRNDGSCTGAAVCPAIPANQVGVGSALNAFVDGTATTKAIVSRFPKQLGGETINAGFAIVNSTGSAGTCDIEYVGSINQNGVVLPASGVINRFAGGIAGVTAGTQNPVSIVCTQPVFVSANTRSDLATYNGDSVTSWNVVNLP